MFGRMLYAGMKQRMTFDLYLVTTWIALVQQTPALAA